VEPEPGDHVLRRDVVHPTHGVAPIRAVLVRARRDVDELRGHALVVERRWRRRDGPFLFAASAIELTNSTELPNVLCGSSTGVLAPSLDRHRGGSAPYSAARRNLLSPSMVASMKTRLWLQYRSVGSTSSKRCGNCTKAVSSPWRASSMKHMAARKAEELLM
jgi:hypothetical protein